MEIVLGKIPTEIRPYTLENSRGMTLEVINFGGIATRLMVPDKNGKLSDVLLGFDDFNNFKKVEHPYFNALIGRYGNRIAKARFSLDDNEFSLNANNGPNTLHGGKIGFDKVFWHVVPLEKENALRLTYVSPNGEEGFPGHLVTHVTYTVTENNEWRIDYEARADRSTPFNPTQHAYFNLSDDKSRSILDHILTLHADYLTTVTDDLIPTGEIASVDGTPFDFRKAKRIGADIQKVPQGGGFDHNWVLNGEDGVLKPAAILHEPYSGRTLQVLTTEPGIQFYSGNFLDGSLSGKQGLKYQKHAGLCLETQHFPDSPNHPHFPSTILRPGQIFRSSTIYKFSS